MDVDYLSFFQDRMARAYEEQMWAVALVGGMNAYVGSQAKQLLRSFKYSTAVIGVAITSLAALAFVVSRHLIFVHYDRQLRTLLSAAGNALINVQNSVPACYETVARYSGVLFYTMVITGMALIALKRLGSEDKRNIRRVRERETAGMPRPS
jgi:hypothetical protein